MLLPLLIVLVMIILFFGFLTYFMYPGTAREGQNDNKRMEDLRSISKALDRYFNDKGFYPRPEDLSFGKRFYSYIDIIPQDPECSSTSWCYGYLATDSNSQWNVLFARVYKTQNINNGGPACSLPVYCMPTNYDAKGFNTCLVSGNLNLDPSSSDCAFIREYSFQ